MVYIRKLNFKEFNLKDDVDQVRALAFLQDKPILFIDPLDKAKQILASIFKELKVKKYDSQNIDFDDKPVLFEKFNYKQDPNPNFLKRKSFSNTI
jgi:hypothetical protein